MNKVRLSARELLDLGLWLERDQPIQIMDTVEVKGKIVELVTRNAATVGAAARVVRHYAEAWESNDEIHPLVLLYILQAVRRTVAGTDGDFGKELGIKRLKAGNPAEVSEKRRLTPTGREEVRIEFEKRISRAEVVKRRTPAGSKRNRIIRELAAEHCVSVRTVENCLCDEK